MLMLTGTVNRNFKRFGSVICTTVATKSKQTKLPYCYCLTSCLQTLVIESNRLPDHVAVLSDGTWHCIGNLGNNSSKVSNNIY